MSNERSRDKVSRNIHIFTYTITTFVPSEWTSSIESSTFVGKLIRNGRGFLTEAIYAFVYSLARSIDI